MRRWMRCSRRDGGGVGVNGARGRAGHREGVLWVRHAVVATPSFFRRRGSGSPAGHDAPPTATVHRPATCRVVAWADRSRCSRVRYVTVWNCLVVLTKHGAEGRRKAGGSGTAGQRTGESRAITAERRDDPSRVGRSSCPRIPWPDKSARRSLWSSGAEGRRWSGSGGTTTPRRLVGGHRLPEVSRARDNMRSTQSRAHRLAAVVDADANRLRPARQPESGGLPRPRERSGRPGRPVQAGPQGP